MGIEEQRYTPEFKAAHPNHETHDDDTILTESEITLDVPAIKPSVKTEELIEVTDTTEEIRAMKDFFDGERIDSSTTRSLLRRADRDRARTASMPAGFGRRIQGIERRPRVIGQWATDSHVSQAESKARELQPAIDALTQKEETLLAEKRTLERGVVGFFKKMFQKNKERLQEITQELAKLSAERSALLKMQSTWVETQKRAEHIQPQVNDRRLSSNEFKRFVAEPRPLHKIEAELQRIESAIEILEDGKGPVERPEYKVFLQREDELLIEREARLRLDAQQSPTKQETTVH